MITTSERPGPSRPGDVLLAAEHVLKTFPVAQGFGRGRRGRTIRAVDDVSFEVRTGETLTIVGQSGCGKSTLARCVTRLSELTSGSVTFDGADISHLGRRDLRPVRRSVQMVFQDPQGALNPRRRVGSIIAEPLRIHGVSEGRARQRQVQELMEIVGLNPEHINRFPNEFSGGQRQRIGIARALALRPRLLVCDEPVSALDVSTQAQILNLLADLQRELGLTYVVIAHDLSVARHISDRVGVMYFGQLVEIAPVEQLFRDPQHPYTAALLSAMPTGQVAPERRRQRIVLTGDLPSAMHPPPGCSFHPRCWRAEEQCAEEEPALTHRGHAGVDHLTSCHFPLDGAMLGSRFGDTPPPEPTVPPRPAPSPPTDRVAIPTVRSSAIEGRSPWRLAAQRLRRDRVAIASCAVILGVALWALAAPLISALVGHPPNEQYHQEGQTAAGLPVGPRQEFILGTDDLGRDLLVRIGYGLRLSLVVAVVATALAVVIGVAVGLAAGYLGGVVDILLARLIDVLLALPFLLVAIAFVSLRGPSLELTILLIALFSWASMARLVRGQVLSIREKEYVEAARSLGASDRRIMWIEVLPHLAGPVIVYATLLLPAIIILEAALAFLGIGTPAPTADLGAMLDSSLTYYRQAWWFVLFPGAALLVVTLAFNLLGDSLRDALDPRADRRR